jgi:predicted helicase
MPTEIHPEAEVELVQTGKWNKSEKSALSSREKSSEPEPRVWRGIFSPTHQKKVLFSQKVKVRTDKLPRMKPHITIDRRTLARAENE